MKTLVLDTSTLILLAKIDLLDAVAIEVELKIPESVQEEATQKKELPDAVLIGQFIRDKKIKVIAVTKTVWVKKMIEDFKLGLGEAEAILLAKEENAFLGIDDGPGIKACKLTGVGFTSALSLLYRFYEKGQISREGALVKIDRLKQYGWYHGSLLIKVADDIRKGESK